ncbi:unnamed protein product, partial [Musa textilis]
VAFCFDLSIPFLEGDSGIGSATSENKARKDASLKAVVRAMELGYAGVLSHADRCKIAPPPNPPAPPLPSTAAFAVAVNGSALLRTYDLVALRPLNQDAFDEACEPVDIISMDFSQKLPFHLRLQSIKACYSGAQGLYFEITYTHLIADAHVRRQILSDAKVKPVIF